MKFYQRFLPYAVAIGSTAIALLLTFSVEPFLPRTIGAFFYIAIMVTAWYGGFRPGFVAVVLSTLAINYWFIPPRYQFLTERLEDVVQLVIFLVVALLINLLTSKFRDSKQKIERLQQKLAQENAQQLRMALSAAQMGMWDWNIVTGEINWSSEHEQLFGLTPGTFEGKYETFEACLHPDDRKGLNQTIERSLKQRVPYQHEYRVVWADGSIHWLEGRGQAFYDEAGQPVRMTGTVMAIDERKQAEAALQEREALLRLFIQYAPAGIAMFDRDMRYIVASQVWVDEYNLGSLESLINQSHYELFPEIPERWRQIHQRCLAGAIEKCDEDLFVRSDGTEQWISWEVHPWHTATHEIGGIIIFAIDITDRKLAEMALVRLNSVLEQRVAERTAELTEVNDRLLEALIALQESEERRRLALDLTHTGFWDLHLPTGKLIWNDNLFTLQGLAPHSIEPSYELCRRLVHPDDVDWIEQQFLESIQNHTDYVVEYRVVHPDGSVHWVMGRGKAIYDELGQPVRSLGVLLDISDRKRAEETLQQYERIISNTKDGIALMNRHYIYQVANQGYLSWCNKYAHEVIGNSVRNILDQDLFDNFIQPRLEQCLAGETIQYERWFDYPNLVPQFLSVTYTPYRDASENISGVIVSLRDLTQLKQAEQMLELQAVITRNMAEGICLVRADNGVIVYANPKFEQMFGYDSGELNGQHVSIVNYASEQVTAEDVARSIKTTILENGEATYEVHNVKKDGTPFWCSATCSVFRHPDYGDVLVAVHQDITDRKQAKEELRQSEAKFRSLSESSPLGIVMTDIGGQCTYINPRYQAICDCTFDEALGEGWVQYIHPEEREEFVGKWSNAVSQRQEFRSEIRYVRKDGTIRFGRLRSAPIFSVADELIGYVATVEDVTDSRAVETMKQEFISIVSHELRTPLTSIRGSLGLVAAGVFKNKPEAAQQMLDIAAHDTERLVRLVNDILDLERLESQKVHLVKQWCDAETLLQQSVKTVQSLAAEGNITLCVEADSIQIWVDCDRIIQTLVNLVSNAIKFSPPETTVTLSVQDQADRVLFQVKDQGRGIPADKLDTIFGRFQQVDASDSRQKGGTGLGLAICKSIVQQHGGKIWVESVVKEGSSFYFTLPKPLD